MADDEWKAPETGMILSEGGTASFEDVTRNFRLLWSRGAGSLFGAYALLMLVQLLLQAPTWALNYVMLADPSKALQVAGVMMLWGLVTIGLGIVVGAVSAGLARPMRALVVEGAGAVGGTGDVLKQAVTRFVPTAGMVVLVALSIAFGLCLLVIPGLAAMFFLFSAVYLVAATDTPFGDAFARSYRISVNNAALVMGVFAALIVYALVIGGLSVGVQLLAQSTLGAFGQAVLAPALIFVLGAAVGFPFLLAYTGFLIALELADSGLQPKGDEGW